LRSFEELSNIEANTSRQEEVSKHFDRETILIKVAKVFFLKQYFLYYLGFIVLKELDKRPYYGCQFVEHFKV
jgi:hypothetical protein